MCWELVPEEKEPHPLTRGYIKKSLGRRLTI